VGALGQLEGSMTLPRDPHLNAAAPEEACADSRPRPFRSMRCACRHCGSHVITNVGFAIAGNCSTCGSYELEPLEPA
jgi:hypothetical protein